MYVHQVGTRARRKERASCLTVERQNSSENHEIRCAATVGFLQESRKCLGAYQMMPNSVSKT